MAEVIYDEVASFELSEMDRGERVEKMVDIYETADDVRVQVFKKTSKETGDTDTKMETTLQTVIRRGSRCSRLAAVCLGLLCVLLLTTNILLYIHHVNVKEETDQNIKNLTEDRHQLRISYQNLTEERDQLKICYQNWNERTWFKDSKKHKSSFYFFSIGLKTWNESRRDCIEKGADLVIINSREEQEFLIVQNKERHFWIGLTDEEEESTWKWVDGEQLTDGFWREGEPNDACGKEDCAIFTVQVKQDLKTWNDLPCSAKESWVCELNLTNAYTLDSHSQSLDKTIVGNNFIPD